MRSELRTVRTGGAPTVVDLTDECAEFVRDEADGLLHVFVPHATAGVAVIETGSGSDDDLLAQLDVLLPRDDRWRHRHGSRGHGRDHVLPAFVPPHASVPVLEGRMQLGTWQRICLVDTNTDNPQRHVRLSYLAVWQQGSVAARSGAGRGSRPVSPPAERPACAAWIAAGPAGQDDGRDRHARRPRPPAPPCRRT